MHTNSPPNTHTHTSLAFGCIALPELVLRLRACGLILVEYLLERLQVNNSQTESVISLDTWQ